MMISVACIQPSAEQVATPSIKLTNLPLSVNDFWVYQKIRYDGPNLTQLVTTTQIITETVIERKEISSLLVAQIHRQQSAETLVAAMQESDRETAILNPALEDSYWLIINGNRVYSQDELDLTTILSSTLEYELPFGMGDSWYLYKSMLAAFPDKSNDSMLRRVTHRQKITVPAGEFESCFQLQEMIGGTIFEQYFCPKVGIVEKRFDHHGTPFGSHLVLIEYAVHSSPN